MALNASDDFNRTNETPLDVTGNWRKNTAPGGTNVNLSSNTIVSDSASSSLRPYYWNTAPSTNDQTSSVDGSSFTDAGATCRMATAAQTWYQADFHLGNGARLYKQLAGSGSQIALGGSSSNATLEGRVTGGGSSLVEAYRGGVQQTSVNDASIASGRVGFYIFEGSVTIDNWVGGDYPLVTLPRFILGTH